MSWSVSAKGNSDEVAKQIESQFESYSPMSEPEEGVKESARAFIAKALSTNIPACERTVTAFGSQCTKYGVNGSPDEIYNTASISIT